MAALARDRPAEEIEIKAVADDILGGGGGRACLGGGPGSGPRASSAYNPTETMAPTAPAASPASARLACAKAAISSAGQKRSQPMPSVRTGGWKTSASVSVG